MSISVVISVAALVLSAATFGVSLWVGHRATVRARKPVLAFVDDPATDCWTLQNIGNGPALNVFVAQRQDGEWFNPVRVRPMAKDQVQALEWLGRVNETGLGAEYADAEGQVYTSTVGGEVLRTYEGRRLPDWVGEEERIGGALMRRYWEAPRYCPGAGRWATVPSDFPAG